MDKKELNSIYQIKNVKQFRGMEGYGFNATLYKGNTKIADFIDDASGGELNVDKLYNEDELKIVSKLCREVGKVKSFLSDREFELDYNIAMFISELVTDYQENKQFKRQCKNKTLYITTETQKKSSYIIWNIPFNMNLVKQLQTTFGDKLVEIINLRYV